MRNILYTSTTIIIGCLLYSCGGPSGDVQLMEPGLLLQYDVSGDTLITREITNAYTTHISDQNYYIPESGYVSKVTEYADQNGLAPLAKINVTVIATEPLDNNLTEEFEWINAILHSMKVHFTLEYNPEDLIIQNLETIKTEGKRNTDLVIRDLHSIIGSTQTDELHSLVICMFDESDFFNTANAIAIPHGGRNYIFGDKDIITSPMLLIHEIGHTMNLTHANHSVKDCHTAYNVMHESNAGCTLGFNTRQLALMNSGKYVPHVDREIYFPENCACESPSNYDLTTEIEAYLNSIDRNIDDTPLVGDLAGIGAFFDELRGTGNTSPLRTALRNNFEAEYDRLVNTGNKSDYVDKRLESHLHLRANNLSRWLCRNLLEVGVYELPSIASMYSDPIYTDSILTMYQDTVVTNMNNCKGKMPCEFRVKCLQSTIDLLAQDGNVVNIINQKDKQILALERQLEKVKIENSQLIGQLNESGRKRKRILNK